MALVDFRPSESVHSVFILNTESEPWQLSNTLRLKGLGSVQGMCYTEIDGAACLVLCCPEDHVVQAVEMIGGRIRWKIDEETLGEGFDPASLAVDKGNVYVADCFGTRLYKVDANTGAVISSIHLFQFCGFQLPHCVRVNDGFIYVRCIEFKTQNLIIAEFTEM